MNRPMDIKDHPYIGTGVFNIQNKVWHVKDEGGKLKKPITDGDIPEICQILLDEFDAHINVQIAARGDLMKYLFKYLHKGSAVADFE